MKQKQYDAMQVITQCSRAFADQMKKCMKNAGLIENGFHLKVLIAPTESVTYKTYSEVELSEYITDVGEEQYITTCMEQFKLGENDWSVRHDPKAKAGTVPENYGSKPSRDVSERVATVSDRRHAPDYPHRRSEEDCPEAASITAPAVSPPPAVLFWP